MNTFTAVVEKDFDTNLYIGYVPGFPGAHSQGETLDELQKNLCEVIEMLLEDEQTRFETVFVGTQQIMVS
ncbi:MAG: type II toxin-antitoxin system HicB family antitoxin [Microcystis aeruginosa]|jgi:predicted RNase H-like HicB family nuclease|uniref:Type II toxin-antitoxin system HicB family antitoxin n=1 Tax=Microcystis aeruginosa Ma_MB_S_20031200_S102 TaxID=2486254 RepID=A0A552EUS0_MICAE|nr:type II toxin-antitoxin system HicB family antitoxin [Microcystis aeruginosa BS13-02]TRU20329.1 MAG: type II toxin-antitoxin system HicB family antitoxin [Microcystis aeruginosa Ma_MB_S_20031200_S102D]TRU38194.1 MAG: type II toxin-antitoxin system HicB family antitoxin [Microcystis aeruginosa Ma_MB_S_20031200_S102]